MSAHLDGNVLAGPLSEIFLNDMTIADACCGGCGDVSVIARAIVDVEATTFVVKCHLCGNTMATLSQNGDQNRLDASGMRWVGVPRRD